MKQSLSDIIQAMREASLPGELIDNPDLTDYEYKWSYVGAVFPGFLLAISWFGGTIFSVQPTRPGQTKVLYIGFAPVTWKRPVRSRGSPGNLAARLCAAQHDQRAGL